MSICTSNLRHSFLTICKIITFKVEEKVFFAALEGDCSVLEAKNTIFSSRFGMRLFRFLFLSELGTYSQNFMPTRGVEP
jgi:hypothetical protein